MIYQQHLHSTMVLFKLANDGDMITAQLNLHSTMVLFKWIKDTGCNDACEFTFHYGPIQMLLESLGVRR